jgi:hypothetical protein
MKKWALLVILLYGIIITVICLVLAGLAVKVPVNDPLVETIIAIWVASTVLCQAGLLIVPVRLAGRRPVTRRHLAWPILVAILSFTAMAVGMFLALWEFFTELEPGIPWVQGLLATGVAALWIGWGVLFGFYTRNCTPDMFMGRLVRFLLAGSILELLVAVPTHVIARARDYCCAGYLTVWGLGLGISVMLFAFGPGVFLLFVRRWQSLQRPARKQE